MCRAIMAMVRGGKSYINHAYEVWGEGSAVARVLKASVPGLDTTDALNELATASAEVLELVAARSVLGRLTDAMKVPLNTRIFVPLTDPVGYWVDESSAKPVSVGAVAQMTLLPAKIAVILPITKELARLGTPKSEVLIRNMLVRSITTAQDTRLLSAVEGEGDTPNGWGHGVTAVESNGDAHRDVVALWDGYDGAAESAVIVTDPRTAAAMALIRTSGGIALFPDCGPRGGSVMGVPLLTSRGSPAGQLTMVDANAIAYGEGLIRLDKAEHATLEMRDDPTGDSVTPTGTTLVSMFQTNSVAIKVEQETNWTAPRAGAVVIVTGATYV